MLWPGAALQPDYALYNYTQLPTYTPTIGQKYKIKYIIKAERIRRDDHSAGSDRRGVVQTWRKWRKIELTLLRPGGCILGE